MNRQTLGVQSQCKGFTLVEIMVVVAIVAILNALAIPAINHIRHTTTATRIANDFRAFRDAFEVYATEEGDWPPSAGHRRIPRGMEQWLSEGAWKAKINDVGAWRWRRSGRPNNRIAFIQLRYPSKNHKKLMTKVDNLIDDGNLSTGNLQRQGNRYRYFLAKRNAIRRPRGVL